MATTNKGSLDEKLVVVLGASSGIGEAMAREFGKNKIKLVLAARRLTQLDKILTEIRDANANLLYGGAYKLDVTRRDDVRQFFEALQQDLGTVPDVLINCAGVMYFGLIKNVKWDEWEQTIDVNCKGVVHACGAVLPGMIARGSGHIVNVSSDAARQTFPALTIYNASKAFVHEFTKGLRCECVGTGIRITELLPGDVRTDLVINNTDVEAAQKVGAGIGEIIGGKDYDAKNPSQRNAVLDPEDVAAAALYAVMAPPHVGVNEILIEPRDQMFGDPTALGVTA